MIADCNTPWQNGHVAPLHETLAMMSCTGHSGSDGWWVWSRLLLGKHVFICLLAYLI